MSDTRQRVRLIDAGDEMGRTTASLFGSLAGRLLALHYTSGVSVVGSIIGGFGVLGREAARTAEGARLRRALEASPAAGNGEAIWSALKIAQWATGIPASPLLDHVRNDLALLLADDLDETLQQPPVPPQTGTPREVDDAEPIDHLDCMLGLWAYSREIVRAIEAVAGPGLDELARVTQPQDGGPDASASLLR